MNTIINKNTKSFKEFEKNIFNIICLIGESLTSYILRCFRTSPVGGLGSRGQQRPQGSGQSPEGKLTGTKTVKRCQLILDTYNIRHCTKQGKYGKIES